MRYQGAVDIFDAGPVIEAQIDHLASLQQAVAVQIQIVPDGALQGADRAILSNRKLAEMRMVLAPIKQLPEQPDVEHQSIAIEASWAAKLQLTQGDLVQLLPLR